MTASWMPRAERSGMPSGWIRQGNVFYCMVCQRDLAGEAARSRVTDEDATLDDLRAAGVSGRITFELERDPDRADTKIARNCHTSVAAVRKVRERLDAYPTRPS